VFSQPAVKDLLKQYVLVQLYTDNVPPQYVPPGVNSRQLALENRKFQEEKFGDLRLPLYVIVEPLPDGAWKEIGRYEEGKINNVAAFMQFLRRPLDKKNGIVAADGAPSSPVTPR
jgi:hypothetical protein